MLLYIAYSFNQIILNETLLKIVPVDFPQLGFRISLQADIIVPRGLCKASQVSHQTDIDHFKDTRSFRRLNLFS